MELHDPSQFALLLIFLLLLPDLVAAMQD